MKSDAWDPRQDHVARRVLRAAARLGTPVIERLLAPAVPRLCRRGPGEIPTVFIIGGPRSGSTLLYQSLAFAYRFAFINNAIARFPRSGPLMARLLGVARWKAPLGRASNYGATRGPAGPSEAGPFWDLVFPFDNHHTVEPEDWPLERRQFARLCLGSLAQTYGAPFLCKNVWHSLRVRALNAAFPSAVFIVMQRDPILMAQSILVRQRQYERDGLAFWSIIPRGLPDRFKLPLAEQVAWQIVLTYEAIQAARDELGEQRFFTLPYEAFCREPEVWLEAVGRFLHRQNITVERRARIDEAFEASTRCDLPEREVAQIEAVFREASLASNADLPMTTVQVPLEPREPQTRDSGAPGKPTDPVHP